MEPRRKIKHFVVLGDSLSDRGMLWARKLLGFPMRLWSGLVGRSPDKRFTNGYVWLDYLAAMYVNKFYFKEMRKKEKALRKKHESAPTEETYAELLKFYQTQMENAEDIRWKGHDFIRSFAEGGVAAYQFIFSPLTTFVGFITRLILSTLTTMRNLLIADDKEKNRGKAEKRETLIIDWTGANDLITVNEKPSKEEAGLAVHARIKNAKKLIKQGYQNLLLFNLPDLSLAPRFANKEDKSETDNAHECSEYFNQKLKDEVERLKKLYPQCKIEIFDVAAQFKEIYDDPEKYQLDSDKKVPDKRKVPYVTSPDFVPPKEGEISTPAPGYMFYDDVHPTTLTHCFLAGKVYDQIKKQYKMTDPAIKHKHNDELVVDEKSLIAAFITKYTKTFYKDWFGFFGEKCHSNIMYRFKDKNFSLTEIFDHALNNGGKRTYKVMQSLQWLDSDGNLNLDNVPALRRAWESVTGNVLLHRR